MEQINHWYGLQLQILPGKDPASSKKYSEEQTSSFRFAIWKIQGWPFNEREITATPPVQKHCHPKSLCPLRLPNTLANFGPSSSSLQSQDDFQNVSLSPPCPLLHPTPTDFVPFSLMLLLKMVFPLVALYVSFLSLLENLPMVPNPTQGPITASTLNAHSTYVCGWGFFLFYSISSIWPLHIILISDFKHQMHTSFISPFTHICLSTTSTAEVPTYTHCWLQGWKALHPYGNCISENNISSTLYDWLPRTWRFFWREAKHLSNECGRTHPHRNQRQAAKFSKQVYRDFSGGSGAKIPSSQCRGPGFYPWLGY